MASKKLRAASTVDEDLQVDMSPMIDMVFLLLIFFIVASSVIVVKQDPSVDPPIADKSKAAKNGVLGRIVVNVRSDGSFAGEVASQVLADEKAIADYIKTEKNKQEGLGLIPVIHLRGDKKGAFKYSRTVIRAGAESGVSEVVFSVFPFANK